MRYTDNARRSIGATCCYRSVVIMLKHNLKELEIFEATGEKTNLKLLKNQSVLNAIKLKIAVLIFFVS